MNGEAFHAAAKDAVRQLQQVVGGRLGQLTTDGTQLSVHGRGLSDCVITAAAATFTQHHVGECSECRSRVAQSWRRVREAAVEHGEHGEQLPDPDDPGAVREADLRVMQRHLIEAERTAIAGGEVAAGLVVTNGATADAATAGAGEAVCTVTHMSNGVVTISSDPDLDLAPVLRALGEALTLLAERIDSGKAP